MKQGEFFISATKPTLLAGTPQRKTTALPQITCSDKELVNPSAGLVSLFSSATRENVCRSNQNNEWEEHQKEG